METPRRPFQSLSERHEAFRERLANSKWYARLMFTLLIISGIGTATLMMRALGMEKLRDLPMAPPIAPERAQFAARTNPQVPLQSTFLASAESTRDTLLAQGKRDGFTTDARFDYSYWRWRITLGKPLTKGEINQRVRYLRDLTMETGAVYLGSQ